MNIEYFANNSNYYAQVNCREMQRTIPICSYVDQHNYTKYGSQLISLPPHAFVINFSHIYAPFKGKQFRFANAAFKMCMIENGKYYRYSGLSGSFFSNICLGRTMVADTPSKLVESCIQIFWTTYFSPTDGIKKYNRIEPHWRKFQPINETDIQQKIDRLNRT